MSGVWRQLKPCILHMTLAAFNNELKTKQKLQQRSQTSNSLKIFTFESRADDFTAFTLSLDSIFSSNEALLVQKILYKDIWRGCHLCHQKKNSLLSQTPSCVNLHKQNSEMWRNCCIPITSILLKHLLLKLYVYVCIWLKVDWTSQKV